MANSNITIFGLEYQGIKGRRKMKDMYILINGRKCYEVQVKPIKPLGGKKKKQNIATENAAEAYEVAVKNLFDEKQNRISEAVSPKEPCSVETKSIVAQ